MMGTGYEKLGSPLDEGYHEDFSCLSCVSHSVSTSTSATQFPASIHNKDIPSITKNGPMHKIEQIIVQYNDYKKGLCTPPCAGDNLEEQLNRGKDFALSILSYYFPEDQGFVIRAKDFSPMSKYGWSIELKVHSKGYDTSGQGRWHLVSPECIAGFKVCKKHKIQHNDGTEGEQLRPHTYFAIIADDCKTQPEWLVQKKKGSVSRGDLLAYALGAEADISKGYGFLIMGRFFEFYQYDHDQESLVSPYPHPEYPQNWSQDMDSQPTPWIADIWFNMLATSDVVYQDGTVGEGSKGNEGSSHD